VRTGYDEECLEIRRMKQEGGNNCIKERVIIFSIAKHSRNDRIKESERIEGGGSACENRSAFKALAGDEGKRPLGRSRRRWVYNIKIYIKKDKSV
jgi:hypothetical protein